jgi:hypothetical protein
MPTMPHTAAGCRIDPPVSVPMAPIASPAATAAPDPLLELPGARSVFHGLRAAGKASSAPGTPYANSCSEVLPSDTAPASLSRA